MSERDWLIVATSEVWTVYGLIDPWINCHVFYVGITSGDVLKRIAQHRMDPSSAAYQVIKDIEKDGGIVQHCVFIQMSSKEVASHLEKALITVLPQIVNRTHEREGAAFWETFYVDRFAA
jgi:predicted GIY-YIG superfamily endonuclease